MGSYSRKSFRPEGLKVATRKSVPALALSVAFAWLQSAVTPKSFTPGALSTYSYLITQPYVMFRYFTSFFLPIHLSADTDLGPLPTIFSLEAFGGFVFLGLLRSQRGVGAPTLVLNVAIDFPQRRSLEPIALDDALEGLAKLRFFAGLSVEESAEALGISKSTVHRDWVTARAWLTRN